MTYKKKNKESHKHRVEKQITKEMSIEIDDIVKKFNSYFDEQLAKLNEVENEL